MPLMSPGAWAWVLTKRLGQRWWKGTFHMGHIRQQRSLISLHDCTLIYEKKVRKWLSSEELTLLEWGPGFVPWSHLKKNCRWRLSKDSLTSSDGAKLPHGTCLWVGPAVIRGASRKLTLITVVLRGRNPVGFPGWACWPPRLNYLCVEGNKHCLGCSVLRKLECRQLPWLWALWGF